jgi:hypothetical protein
MLAAAESPFCKQVHTELEQGRGSGIVGGPQRQRIGGGRQAHNCKTIIEEMTRNAGATESSSSNSETTHGNTSLTHSAWSRRRSAQ